MKSLPYLTPIILLFALAACVSVESPPSSATGAAGQSVPDRACLDAVAAQTRNTVEKLSSSFSEAGTMVMVGVGENNAPWQCMVSNDGIVQQVMFVGDDSAGVPTIDSRPAIGSATDLTAFEGARAGQAEMGIMNLGYELVRSEGLTSFWRNRNTGACARITTSNGRYSDLAMVPGSNC